MLGQVKEKKRPLMGLSDKKLVEGSKQSKMEGNGRGLWPKVDEYRLKKQTKWYAHNTCMLFVLLQMAVKYVWKINYLSVDKYYICSWGKIHKVTERRV